MYVTKITTGIPVSSKRASASTYPAASAAPGVRFPCGRAHSRKSPMPKGITKSQIIRYMTGSTFCNTPLNTSIDFNPAFPIVYFFSNR